MRNWKGIRAGCLGLVLACGAALSAEGRPPEAASGVGIVNGGFESEERNERGIPPGWSMWGGNESKIPENYRRDTTVSHSGRASLRYFQPRGMSGYFISTPRLSPRLQPRTDYLFRVWIRAERQAELQVMVFSYSDPARCTDWAPLSTRRVAAGPEWRPVELPLKAYELVEGLNVSLMLSVKILTSWQEDQTVWVDDAGVAASPSIHANLTPAEIRPEPREPLNHRLKPGKELRIDVDAAKGLRRVNRKVLGISLHMLGNRYAGPYDLKTGEYILRPSSEEAVRALRLPLTRLNSLGGEPWPLLESLDKTALLAGRLGIPEEAFVLELEGAGRVMNTLSPADWANAVRYSRSQGYGFCLWEVANEPVHGGLYTPETYLAQVKAVSAAIKARDPGARVGMALYPEAPGWSVFLLREAAGSYDFVCPHLYGGVPASAGTRDVNLAPVEETALVSSYEELETALRINRLLEIYNPGGKVSILDTEWGLHASDSRGTKADDVNRNGN
ncbi:MAG: hypothetical protein V1918_09525, partial [Planctomycetota bacterium]